MTKIGTVFSELLKLVSSFRFAQAVNRYSGDRYTKHFSCWRQFITLLYAEITQKDSLRDIETNLATQASRWYHLRKGSNPFLTGICSGYHGLSGPASALAASFLPALWGTAPTWAGEFFNLNILFCIKHLVYNEL